MPYPGTRARQGSGGAPMSVTALRPRGNQPRTAFVMGGGGNLGAVQVGMLNALFDRGITPDVLVGCSVGALNAAVLAADPTPTGLQRLRDVWLDRTTWQVFSSGKMTGPWLLFRKGRSMVGNERLRTLLDRHVPNGRFEDL